MKFVSTTMLCLVLWVSWGESYQPVLTVGSDIIRELPETGYYTNSSGTFSYYNHSTGVLHQAKISLPVDTNYSGVYYYEFSTNGVDWLPWNSWHWDWNGTYTSYNCCTNTWEWHLNIPVNFKNTPSKYSRNTNWDGNLPELIMSSGIAYRAGKYGVIEGYTWVYPQTLIYRMRYVPNKKRSI